MFAASVVLFMFCVVSGRAAHAMFPEAMGFPLIFCSCFVFFGPALLHSDAH